MNKFWFYFPLTYIYLMAQIKHYMPYIIYYLILAITRKIIIKSNTNTMSKNILPFLYYNNWNFINRTNRVTRK